MSSPASHDHYHTLGLARHAEGVVVKAAYRALASQYHPDRNPSPDAIERIQRINAAYEILSDPARRLAYDASLGATVEGGQDATVPVDDDTDPLAESWQLAIGFFPDLVAQHAELRRFSPRLADDFRLQLLQHQDFTASAALAERFKRDYLKRHFGADDALQHYAEQLIKAREVDAARFVNRIVTVLGPSVGVASVRSKVEERYPRCITSLRKRELYARIRQADAADLTDIGELVALCDGTLQRGLLRATQTLRLGTRELKFTDDEELRQYVLRRLSGECD
jgi:hypothetical protein